MIRQVGENGETFAHLGTGITSGVGICYERPYAAIKERKIDVTSKVELFRNTLSGGYFPLPSVYCLAWICLDVLFCTASIMHLCTISVDRYLSLRYPMKFGRNKTRRRVTLKIIFVWLLSIAMSLPLSLMYSKVSPGQVLLTDVSHEILEHLCSSLNAPYLPDAEVRQAMDPIDASSCGSRRDPG
ncbi:hypothetical protein KM043_007830 [Ampulex compressa]|nr:hypothetical protein KM043_007830 [Ampulex compressa]